MGFYEWILSSWWLCLGAASCLIVSVTCFWMLIFRWVDERLKREGRPCGACNGMGYMTWANRRQANGPEVLLIYHEDEQPPCRVCNGSGRVYHI